MMLNRRIKQLEQAMNRKRGRLLVWRPDEGKPKPPIGPHDTVITILRSE